MAEIAEEVAAGAAVVLTVRFVPDAWYHPKPGPLIEAAPQAPRIGSHAVVVVGVLAGDDDLPDALLVKNSWGQGWGDEGYGYLAESYLAEHGVAAHVLEGE